MGKSKDPNEKDEIISDDLSEMEGKSTADQEAGWMLRFKSGDQYGFLKILQRYEKPVINFAYKFLRDREAAEDVAQDVFLAVHQKAQSYEAKGKLSTWIFTMAHNRCVDLARRKKVLSFFSLDKTIDTEENETTREFPEAVEDDPSSGLEKKEKERAVRAAIATLPPHQKTAVLLAKFEGMELIDIAKVMKVSEGAVKQLIHRAKLHLKDELRDTVDMD